MSDKRSYRLKIWRQKSGRSPGRMESYSVDGVTPDMSLLEMLDLLNNRFLNDGIDPVAFDSDCREGICGACGLVRCRCDDGLWVRIRIDYPSG